MEVLRLPPRVIAPPDADCIRLHQLADGRVRLEGSLLDGDGSVSLTRSYYPSTAQAESAGLAWAGSHGVLMRLQLDRGHIARVLAEESGNIAGRFRWRCDAGQRGRPPDRA